MSFPLNLGIRAHDIYAATPDELTGRLNELQLRHVQFAIKKSFPESAPSLIKISSGAASFFGEQLRQKGIKISVLGCYVNIVDSDPKKRQLALASFKRHLALAKDFGASFVGSETGSVATGYTPENFTEESYQKARASVMELVAYGEAVGTPVAIEAGVNHPLYSLELTKRLVREVASPNLRIIFDCANLMTMENYRQQEKIAYTALDQLQDVIEMIHLKDFTFTDGKLQYAPVGQGLMKWQEILQFAKYSKPLVYTSLEATTGAAIKPACDFLLAQYDRI